MPEITIKDIARICNVGVSTVSRAINNHPDINPETKEAIMNVIKEHHYIPNNSARNLKRTDAKTIALLVKGISNPFFSKIIKIMEEEIKVKKYTLVLYHVKNQEDEVEVALELVKEKRLRGIIFLGGFFNHSEEKLAKLKVPFVLSTVGVPSNTVNRNKYSSVSVDDKKESDKLISYLIGLGHKKIAILTAPLNDESIGKLRLQGYFMAHEEHNLRVNENLICCMNKDQVEYSMENGYNLTKNLLDSNEEFTAIFAISDNMAIGACKAISDAGKSVPGDYTVVGYDGIDVGNYYNPSLTTMAQPIDMIAYETMKQLFEVIESKGAHQHKVFSAQLTIRQSSDRPNNTEKK